ncbi:MAG: tetratricopeptide repeat protein [Alphaproteobacteria bacterium]|nr:tetratricopeptide repeat protein [Alphaproteobacteria bacterium]
MALARQHHAAGRLLEAEKLYRQVLQAEPDRPDALLLLGVLSRRAGKSAVAFDLITRALASRPDDAEAHNNLGNVLQDLGRPDEAVASFNRAIAIRPDYAEAHYNLGMALRMAGHLQEAVASYRRALSAKPEYPRALHNLGNALLDLARPDEAAASFRKALAIDPHFAEAHCNLGNALGIMGRLEEAVASYRRALECKPAYAQALNNLGDSLRKLGRRQAAQQAFSRALELDPSLAQAELGLGLIAKQADNMSEALVHFGRALALDPRLAAAHSEMARVQLLMGDARAALANARAAVAIDPQSYQSHISLSAALAQDGRKAEANETSLKAVRFARSQFREFTGHEPLGSVLVLKAIEDGYFVMEPGFGISVFDSGMNNADAHFDQSKFEQKSFYVDGFEPATEISLLPKCDVIYNTISDIDAVPICHEIVRQITEHVAVPVINAPDRIAQTRRHTNYQRLRDIDGIVFPATLHLKERLRSRTQITRTLDDAGMPFPLLARRAGTHTGESLEKVDDIEQLEAYFSRHPEGPYYLVEFIDFFDPRGGYVKMRVFSVDGALYPSQFVVSDEWYSQVSTRIYRFMSENKWMIESAEKFHSDPERYLGSEAFRAMNSVQEKLQLDYFGIDFTQLVDGSVLIFEANAAMRLPYLSSGELDPVPYRKPGVAATEQALDRLLEEKVEESRALRGG